MFRHVEILRDDEWVRDEFENIRKGDTFKLYEPDGTLIAEVIAVSDPQPCDPEGNWKIEHNIPDPEGVN